MERANENAKRQMTQEDFEKLPLEEQNQMLKKAYAELMAHAQKLEQTWLLTRMSFLNEIVKCDSYAQDLKDKCIKEIEGFLFPKEESK